MKLLNGELEPVASFLLNELPLAGKRSRMRTKLYTILLAKHEEFRKFHLQLLKEHCNLDENGNPKTVHRGDQEVYDIIDEEAFFKEYQELAHEEVAIEENEENQEMLTVVQGAVEDCPTAFQGQQAVLYERVASLFDHIYD